MKIELTNGTILETEQLPDGEAMVMEKLNELYKLSAQYEIPMYASAAVNGKPMCFHNFVDKDKFLMMVAYTAFCFSRWTDGDVRFVAIVNDANPNSEVEESPDETN